MVYIILLYGSDPIVAFDNRLFLPAFVLLLPLALQGISTALLLYLESRDKVFAFSLYFLCFCLAFYFMPMMSLSDYRYFSQNPVEGNNYEAKWYNG